MHHRILFHRSIRTELVLAILSVGSVLNSATAAPADELRKLIARGEFAEAEKRLRPQIDDPTAPVTSEPAVQLEILRRTRQDFALTKDDVLKQIKESIPDATQDDVDRWRTAGDLQSRVIDGQTRYFGRAVSNLFRFNAEAKRRQVNARSEQKFDTTALVEKLVRMSESADEPEIYPVNHSVRYELIVHDGHPRVKPGATVRAWLPYPQEYRRQQRDVKLVRTDPPHVMIADAETPQRTIYFEQKIESAEERPLFVAEFEFVTTAYCPKLDSAKVQPYDVGSAVYRELTAERPPHIVFTPEVKALAREIVGSETNPLEKALRVFRWVSANVPWCAEMEYSVIPNLTGKGLAARRGDCGVQGMTFITLCRAAGVPARWQSGWQTKPGDWNMHDWSEIYIEPWGWLPVDASYGVREHADPRVRDFFCGHMDPYRLIVNLDYARELQPPKTSFRSEPNDFQRGEIEIDGHNLYFDEWDYKFRVETTPLVEASARR
jgi:transglutaminase-like putative cysteine protease